MPAKKMRVEVFDDGGNRYTITFEGQVTREKALRLLDLVELLGGMPAGNPEWNSSASDLSKFDKVRLVIDKCFPVVWFSSKDAQGAYEEEFKEPVSLSTISTYLARMADRETLLKSGSANSKRYRVVSQAIQSSINFAKGNK